MSSYNYYNSFFISSNGKNKISYYVYEPKDRSPRGIVQLSHGMCEYVRRYEHVAEFLTSNGYVFCGNDHLGHGESVENPDELGFTSEGGGADHILNDLHTMTSIAKETYPDIPLVLYGHSMGSFYARLYLSKFGDELSGALIEGTAGSETPTGLGKSVISLMMKFKGDHYRSPMIDNMAFGSYNKRFGGKNAPASAWVTSSENERRKYEGDPLCAFKFTLQGYYDLFDVLSRVSSKKWAESVPKVLPIFLVAGENDPVGNYGRGVTSVYERLRASGHENLSVKLYPDARHEVHNEVPEIRAEFLSDIMKFIDSVCDSDGNGKK